MLSAWRYDTHTKEVPVSRSYDAPRGRSSKVQACMPCREKKTRCSGDATSQRPCFRCRLKSLPCQYDVCVVKKPQSRLRVLGRVPVKKSYVEPVEEGKQGSEGGARKCDGTMLRRWMVLEQKHKVNFGELEDLRIGGKRGSGAEMPRPVIGDEVYAMFDPLVRGDEIAWKEQRGRDICAEGGTWKEDWNGDENGCGHVNGVQYGYTSVGDAMAAESMLARRDAEQWRVEEGALQNGFHKGVCEQTGWLVE
ncbi:hypothetical protein E4U52_003027 [Claviceps spartinae]|nr:hypothetical protein E4U52_003027 [Claviceps spartinae]